MPVIVVELFKLLVTFNHKFFSIAALNKGVQGTQIIIPYKAFGTGTYRIKSLMKLRILLNLLKAAETCEVYKQNITTLKLNLNATHTTEQVKLALNTLRSLVLALTYRFRGP